MTSGLWERVLDGVWVTIQLLVLSALLATAVSFVVGIARTHRLWIVRFLAGFYTEVFRGTSALVMIFWVFFVLPPGLRLAARAAVGGHPGARSDLRGVRLGDRARCARRGRPGPA